MRLLAVAILLTGLSGVAGLVGVSASSPATGFTLGGEPCEPVSMETAAPISLGSGGQCQGVRPGAAVLTEQGQCTFNFMWRGSDGGTYMGTAGHCALGVTTSGEFSWDPGDGPPAADGQGNLIGEFAYAVVDDPRDFALIRLAPGVAASPQTCHFGGPTGISTDQGLIAPTLLQQYGQGSVLGQVVPGRPMLAVSLADPDILVATGVVMPGDSGSGVTTVDGRAVGVVVTTGLYVGVLDAGTVGITRLAPQIARAEQATGVDYTLQTAPAL
jgi:hypothetical protein